jgi:hypothetical protein
VTGHLRLKIAVYAIGSRYTMSKGAGGPNDKVRNKMSEWQCSSKKACESVWTDTDFLNDAGDLSLNFYLGSNIEQVGLAGNVAARLETRVGLHRNYHTLLSRKNIDGWGPVIPGFHISSTPWCDKIAPPPALSSLFPGKLLMTQVVD